MELVVQKFGGTSVQSKETREMAFNHIQKAIRSGKKVVVVVSAIGRIGDPYATDTLLELIGAGGTKLTEREQDMFVAVGELISTSVFTNMLKEAGVKAEGFSGGQAGIHTTSDYQQAKITKVDPGRILAALEHVDVAVVAGFQGIAPNGDVTTLGRGGSDTSAAALGVALKAHYVDIFTDVDGMMTADPRIVEHAHRLNQVSYEEVSNMANHGAKVIHPRAVEIAMKGNIPMRIRSTYLDGMGTLITGQEALTEKKDVGDRLVTGVAHVPNLTQFTVPANGTAIQKQAFQVLADAAISLDFINISTENIVFTVPFSKKEEVIELLKTLDLEAKAIDNCAKVAVVGAGITGVAGVTAKIVSALAEHQIPILQSADSHTTIWVLVNEADMIIAVNALHDIFCLG